jgi:hypothetical protein
MRRGNVASEQPAREEGGEEMLLLPPPPPPPFLSPARKTNIKTFCGRQGVAGLDADT